MSNRNRNRRNQSGGQYRGQQGSQYWPENQREGMRGYGQQDWGAGSLATGSMYGQSGRTGTQGGYAHEHEDRPSEYGSMGYGQSPYGQRRMEREGYGQTGYGQSNRGDYSGQYPMQGRYSEPYRNEGQYYNQSGGDYRDSGQSYSGQYSQGQQQRQSSSPYSGQYGQQGYAGYQSRSHRQDDLDGYENDYSGRPISGAYSTEQPRQNSGNSGINSGSWRSNNDAWNGGSYELQHNQRGKAPKNYRKSDDRVRDDVSERLVDDGYDCSEVDVNCKDGIVTLSGECCDRDTKHGMERSASDVHGVKDVDNQLRMKHRDSSEDSGSKNRSSAESSGAGLSSGSGSSDWKNKNKM
ncbi:MAG: BON domain-containing protein [Phycisphaeraceae bacterium]|nr:BON domain-containing protein [Phycisphaeraceae bacterium]